MDVTPFLRHMIEVGASDLHLKAGMPPVVRIDGELHRTSFPTLTAADTEAVALALLPAHKADEFLRTHEADIGHALERGSRFRVNVFRQRGLVGLAIRRVHTVIPTFEELGLPSAAAALAEETRGLVLVTGPAGTGKTTTIAAMVGWINRNRSAHVITIEDPIEVVHEDDRSIVDQREIGMDTASYGSALRYVVRQDPDVIFIGEIRDMETAEAAIQAAETGHLVISTLHTLDATETVNRLIDLFPKEMQRQVRVSLAASLRGVLSQRLVPRADASGRVPAVEVMINTGRVAERIVDPAETSTIPDVIAEGGFYGMQTFDQALAGLVQMGLVTVEDAAASSSNRHDFLLTLKQAQLA
ncbi:MAG TPA: PilT/PilU family type 4a pilus ATPase [Actinomycetota bacterium]|nr:PilT/PilU family type 4a pilus ATPase [Actinomycetota bacterium]